MQAVRRSGLAQVSGSPMICLITRPPQQAPTALAWGFAVQARGRLLRSKVANDAGFASIAGLDKVRGGVWAPGATGGAPRVCLNPVQCPFQAPMSRIEPDQYINDRYQAIEDRLQVRSVPLPPPVHRRRCRRRRSNLPPPPPAAGRPQAPEQASDLCGEGGSGVVAGQVKWRGIGGRQRAFPPAFPAAGGGKLRCTWQGPSAVLRLPAR